MPSGGRQVMACFLRNALIGTAPGFRAVADTREMWLLWCHTLCRLDNVIQAKPRCGMTGRL